MLIFALCFIFDFKAHLQYIETIRKKSDVYLVSSLCFGNYRQQKPVCGKMISSWVRKVLSIAKEYMFLCTVCGTGACGWCCLNGPSCRQVTELQLDTIFEHISPPQVDTRI